MNNGFIVLYRSLLEWEWYSDANTTRLFLHCLLRANHKDNKWQGIMIDRGSFVTSYEKLSQETGLSVRSVRTSLNKLKTTCELTIKTSTKNTVIVINNYNLYQSSDTPTDKRTTNKRQTNDKQTTTNNNDNNVTMKQGNKRDAHGSHVKLTQEQLDALVTEYGLPLITTMIDRMNEYIGMKGKPYKDYNLAIRKWIREEQKNNPKWLPELKAEQDAHDAKEYKPKRSAEELKEGFNKL
jgi:hypothetical protein